MNQDQKAELYMVINAGESSKWGGRVVPFDGGFRAQFQDGISREICIGFAKFRTPLSLATVCNEFPSTVAWNQGNFASFLDTRLIL